MTDVPEQRPIPPCPDCGGRRVGGLGLTGRGAHYMGLWPRKRHRFTGNEKLAAVEAYVCLACGYVKFYADDLATLRRAAEEHPEWLKW
jgi:hypothetical protein